MLRKMVNYWKSQPDKDERFASARATKKALAEIARGEWEVVGELKHIDYGMTNATNVISRQTIYEKNGERFIV